METERDSFVKSEFSSELSRDNPDWRVELDKCARCGTCRSVCPVFRQLSDETLVARGRLVLIKAALEKKLPLSPHLAKIVDCCLLCLRCQTACPSLVKTGEAIQSARAWLVKKQGLSLSLKFGFRFVLPHKKIYDFFMMLFSLAQTALGGFFKMGQGRLRHLPFVFSNLLTLSRQVPPIQPQPALKKSATRYRGAPAKPRVAIFSGCMINYVYPGVLRSMTDVLRRAGVSFVVPKEQVCCGIPALVYGDTLTARRLAKKNIRALQPDKVDFILTACGTCGQMLKDEYAALYRNETISHTLRHQLTALNNKVMDIMEFIQKHTDFSTVKQNINTAYHTPCHFLWNNSAEITKNILGKISDYRETDKEGLCCGGGGLFSLKYRDLGLAIGRLKMETLDFFARAGQPSYLITGCPGCMMQLTWLLKESGMSHIKVAHSIEFFNKSLKAIYS